MKKSITLLIFGFALQSHAVDMERYLKGQAMAQVYFNEEKSQSENSKS